MEMSWTWDTELALFFLNTVWHYDGIPQFNVNAVLLLFEE